MIGAIAVVTLVGYDIDHKILTRLRLTRLSSPEYIGGILITWSFVALFQSGILIAIAYALGFLRVIGTALHISLAVIALAIAGILTAAIGLIIISFTSERASMHIIMIFLIPLSLFVAGYFPVPNPVVLSVGGYTLTLLDLLPWRAAVVAVKKSLMLPNIYSPAEVIPDIIVLIAWTLLYSVISFIAFSSSRLKSRK